MLPGSHSVRSARDAALDAGLAALMQEPAYGPGARLPNERTLAERFQVSRSALRAALARLEGRGRILRIMGSGTYVAQPSQESGAANAAGKSSRPPGRAPGDASPQEIMQARMLIEPQLPVLVVANANGADLDRIGAAMRSAERAETLEDFEVWDGRFHQAIADATHNRLVIEIYRIVTDARNHAEWGALKRRNATPVRRAQREAEHKAIYAALQSRDADGARRAFDAHLHRVNRNLFGQPA